MKPIVSFTSKLVLLVLLAGVLYFTNDLFLLVGSSANISHLIAPSWLTQTIEYVLCALCLLIPANGGRRVALFILALVFALLSGHRLIIDNFNHRLNDMYLAISVQTVPLDPDTALKLQLNGAGASINQTGTNHALHVVTPIFFGLDRSRLAIVTSP